MSEHAPTELQDFGLANHEQNDLDNQAELELAQKYRNTLSTARSLIQASGCAAQEAVDAMDAVGRRYTYAAPDDQGVLVLNIHGSTTSRNPSFDIEEEASKYQKTIERIAEHGYLDPDTSRTLRRTISVDTIDTRLPMHSMMFFKVLDDPIRMHLGEEGTATKDTFHRLAAGCDLDESAAQTLESIAENMQKIEDNPDYGSNHLYSYSAPFLEMGTVRDTLQARLGVTYTHMNDGAGLDHVDFEGVPVPVDEALDVISNSIDRYARLAEPEKARAAEAPAGEDLHQDILDKREASAKEFTKQLQRFAPEVSVVSDDVLLSLVKTAADSQPMYGSHLEDTAIGKHIIEVARDNHAGFGGISHKDNNEQLSRDRSEQPRFWEPTSVLDADGLTGLVTRVDYEERPWQPGGMRSSKLESRRVVVYDADKSARMRSQMAAIRMERG